MLSQSHFAFRTNKCSTLKPCKTHESGPLALLTFGMSHQMRPPFFLLAKHRLRRRSDIASMLQHQMKAPCTSQILRQKAFLGGTLTQNFQRLSLTKTPARTALDVQGNVVVLVCTLSLLLPHSADSSTRSVGLLQSLTDKVFVLQPLEGSVN